MHAHHPLLGRQTPVPEWQRRVREGRQAVSQHKPDPEKAVRKAM